MINNNINKLFADFAEKIFLNINEVLTKKFDLLFKDLQEKSGNGGITTEPVTPNDGEIIANTQEVTVVVPPSLPSILNFKGISGLEIFNGDATNSSCSISWKDKVIKTEPGIANDEEIIENSQEIAAVVPPPLPSTLNFKGISDFDAIPENATNSSCKIPWQVEGIKTEPVTFNNGGLIIENAQEITAIDPPSLSITTNMKGMYGFDVIFPENASKVSHKKPSWKYSSERDKLYVSKDLPCPISFTISAEVRDKKNLKIRAKVIFTQQEYTTHVVKRCQQHKFDDTDSRYNVFLIRCDTPTTEYYLDQVTEETSIAFPFENISSTETLCTYSFKFTCRSSCEGIDRKPLAIVFTLEENGAVIGRRCIAVKICACPFRDCKLDDDKIENNLSSKKRKVSPDVSDISLHCPLKKKPEQSQNKTTYTIATSDLECYTFLKNAKDLFKMQKAMKNLTSEQHVQIQRIMNVKKKTSDDSSE